MLFDIPNSLTAYIKSTVFSNAFPVPAETVLETTLLFIVVPVLIVLAWRLSARRPLVYRGWLVRLQHVSGSYVVQISQVDLGAGLVGRSASTASSASTRPNYVGGTSTGAPPVTTMSTNTAPTPEHDEIGGSTTERHQGLLSNVLGHGDPGAAAQPDNTFTGNGYGCTVSGQSLTNAAHTASSLGPPSSAPLAPGSAIFLRKQQNFPRTIGSPPESPPSSAGGPSAAEPVVDRRPASSRPLHRTTTAAAGQGPTGGTTDPATTSASSAVLLLVESPTSVLQATASTAAPSPPSSSPASTTTSSPGDGAALPPNRSASPAPTGDGIGTALLSPTEPSLPNEYGGIVATNLSSDGNGILVGGNGTENLSSGNGAGTWTDGIGISDGNATGTPPSGGNETFSNGNGTLTPGTGALGTASISGRSGGGTRVFPVQSGAVISLTTMAPTAETSGWPSGRRMDGHDDDTAVVAIAAASIALFGNGNRTDDDGHRIRFATTATSSHLTSAVAAANSTDGTTQTSQQQQHSGNNGTAGRGLLGRAIRQLANFAGLPPSQALSVVELVSSRIVYSAAGTVVIRQSSQASEAPATPTTLVDDVPVSTAAPMESGPGAARPSTGSSSNCGNAQVHGQDHGQYCGVQNQMQTDPTGVDGTTDIVIDEDGPVHNTHEQFTSSSLASSKLLSSRTTTTPDNINVYRSQSSPNSIHSNKNNNNHQASECRLSAHQNNHLHKIPNSRPTAQQFDFEPEPPPALVHDLLLWSPQSESPPSEQIWLPNDRADSAIFSFDSASSLTALPSLGPALPPSLPLPSFANRQNNLGNDDDSNDDQVADANGKDNEACVGGENVHYEKWPAATAADGGQQSQQRGQQFVLPRRLDTNNVDVDSSGVVPSEPGRPGPPPGSSGTAVNCTDCGEGSSSTTTIRLKFLDDSIRVVPAWLETPVGEFRQAQFPAECQAGKVVRLIYRGQLLRDDYRSLASYGLHNGCVVHCHVGGRPYSSAGPGHQQNSPNADESLPGSNGQAGQNHPQNRIQHGVSLVGRMLTTIPTRMLVRWIHLTLVLVIQPVWDWAHWQPPFQPYNNNNQQQEASSAQTQTQQAVGLGADAVTDSSPEPSFEDHFPPQATTTIDGLSSPALAHRLTVVAADLRERFRSFVRVTLDILVGPAVRAYQERTAARFANNNNGANGPQQMQQLAQAFDFDQFENALNVGQLLGLVFFVKFLLLWTFVLYFPQFADARSVFLLVAMSVTASLFFYFNNQVQQQNNNNNVDADGGNGNAAAFAGGFDHHVIVYGGR